MRRSRRQRVGFAWFSLLGCASTRRPSGRREYSDRRSRSREAPTRRVTSFVHGNARGGARGSARRARDLRSAARDLMGTYSANRWPAAMVYAPCAVRADVPGIADAGASALLARSIVAGRCAVRSAQRAIGIELGGVLRRAWRNACRQRRDGETAAGKREKGSHVRSTHCEQCCVAIGPAVAAGTQVIGTSGEAKN